MDRMVAARVMNGTWGEAWMDGSKLAEVVSAQAIVEQETEDIQQTGQLVPGKKVTGMKCEGSMKLHKVSRYVVQKMNENIKKGKQTVVTIVMKIDDPDAIAAERVVIKDALLTKMTLIDFETKKLGEEEIPFTFTDWEVI